MRHSVTGCVVVLTLGSVALQAAEVKKARTLRVPDGGIQPQAVERGGTLHMIYYKGDALRGDIFYVRSQNAGATFSSPIRVNSQEGSAIAAGTIRGAQIAIGKAGRIHVAWNGSATATPAGPLNPESGKPGSPMLYTRSIDSGTGFEEQRNLMQATFGLDGGGSIASDDAGHVYAAWHAKTAGSAKGEAGRAVWVVRSEDDGNSFSREAPAWQEPTGACACCGMRLFADSKGALYGLYRSATKDVNRDIHLLVSKDNGRSFRGRLLDPWEINACPMSSMSISESAAGIVAAWETKGRVYYAPIDRNTQVASRPISAPETGKSQKHPAVAGNAQGETILVWAEGTGWQKGGSLAWQVFDRNGKPTSEKGEAPGVPVWSFGTVLTLGGVFTVIY